MSNNSDPYILETIIERYRKRNEALEKRESEIIRLLAEIEAEKSSTSNIEETIRGAISGSNTCVREIRPDDLAFYNMYCAVEPQDSKHYPRSSGRLDGYLPLPLERDPRVPYKPYRLDSDLDSRSRNFISWRKFPKNDTCLDYTHDADEVYEKLSAPSLEAFKHSSGRVFRTDSNRDYVTEVSPKRDLLREMSPERDYVRVTSPSSRRQQELGARPYKREAMKSDPDVERLLQMAGVEIPCDSRQSHNHRTISSRFGRPTDQVSDTKGFPSTVDSMLNFDMEQERLSTHSCNVEKDGISNYIKNLMSPSVQDMMSSYEREHGTSPCNGGEKSNTSCRRKSRPDSGRRVEFERDIRPKSLKRGQRESRIPLTDSTSLCHPYSDSDRELNSNECVKTRHRPTFITRDQPVDVDHYITKYESQRPHSREREVSGLQKLSVHDNFEHECVDADEYEFDENYSNNYLTFLIRNCLPKSLLRSQYSSSYVWSSRNKQDIINKIEEIEVIKKIIREELDYRDSVNKPFKIHRYDRKILLRNIMYAEAVKLGLAKGLPICGVMALFGETRSTENIKALTLQTIRQGNEILGEYHPDPVGLEAIEVAAVGCLKKLKMLEKRPGMVNSSKLGKILQDIISREPILDPCGNLEKCIEDFKYFVVDDTQAIDDVYSQRTEVCRLKNIIWSMEEHMAMKKLRENTEVECANAAEMSQRRSGNEMFFHSGGFKIESSTQKITAKHHKTQTDNNSASRHAQVADMKHDGLTKEPDLLKCQVERMKSHVFSLEHNKVPNAMSRKNEVEQQKTNTKTTNKTLISCDSSTVTAMKSNERIRCQGNGKQGSKLPEPAAASVEYQSNSSKKCVYKERDSLKGEVDRLKSLIDNMERNLVVPRNPGQAESEQVNVSKKVSEKNNLHDAKTKLSANTTNEEPQCTANVDRNVVIATSTDTLNPTTQSTHCCMNECNHNPGHVCKRVFYLVKNKHNEVLAGAKDCINKSNQIVTKTTGYNTKTNKPSNTVNNQMAVHKGKRIILAVTPKCGQCQGREGDKGMNETKETIVTKCGGSICTTHAQEHSGTDGKLPENLNKATARNLPAIPETFSDVFLSAECIDSSLQSFSSSTDGDVCSECNIDSQQEVNEESICNDAINQSDGNEVNTTAPKRKNINPAANMWENMVDALIPGFASKRKQHAGERGAHVVANSSSTEIEDSTHLLHNSSGTLDQSFNSQTDENIYRIVHKSGSAYEISSALKVDDETSCPMSGKVDKKESINDISKQLALAVKICNGPDAAAQNLKEAFKESYLATYEKAINDALKDILNCYPLTNGGDGKTAKAKKTCKTKTLSRKRSTMELDGTTLSDCSSHYTKDDVVLVGTTEMNGHRNVTRDPSSTSVITNASRKQKKVLAAAPEKEIRSVSNESSSTILVTNGPKKQNKSPSATVEKHMTFEPSYTMLVSGASRKPKDKDTATNTVKRISANANEPSDASNKKADKVSSALGGKRFGISNKSEQRNGTNASKKIKDKVITGRTIKKLSRPFNRSSKEGNTMTVTSNYARESDNCRKKAKPERFNNKSSSNGIFSRKIPIQAGEPEACDALMSGENIVPFFSEPIRGKRGAVATKKGADKKVAAAQLNSEISILFDGADRMADTESRDNTLYFDAEESAKAVDSTSDEIIEMDCSSALKTVSRVEMGPEYKIAMLHVKNCTSCTKKLMPTLLNVVNKVEQMTRICENSEKCHDNELKAGQERNNKRTIALRGRTR